MVDDASKEANHAEGSGGKENRARFYMCGGAKKFVSKYDVNKVVDIKTLKVALADFLKASSDDIKGKLMSGRFTEANIVEKYTKDFGEKLKDLLETCYMKEAKNMCSV